MPRYEQSYTGERRTSGLCVQLTPSERTELETAAEASGARLSQYVRELCLSRSGAPQTVAGTRRNPEAKALMGELSAIGNNLNQLTRLANTHGALPEARDLRAVLEQIKTAMGHVLAL